MLNSIQSPSALASVPSQVVSAPASWADQDDVAFGCECADPTLQIDSWGQDASESCSGGLSAL